MFRDRPRNSSVFDEDGIYRAVLLESVGDDDQGGASGNVPVAAKNVDGLGDGVFGALGEFDLEGAHSPGE